ncbi:MAG: (2Fe-2S)-binding protein [Acidobacteriota bacterium]
MSQPPLHLKLRVNDEEHHVSTPPHATLLETLREDLELTGTKHGCELGECGACAVLVDGSPLLSCLTLSRECEGKSVETIEGVAGDSSELHPLQEAFADLGGSQCGYCTSGLILTAKSLVENNDDPSRATIAEALSGNICRCTGYLQVLDAVEKAVQVLKDRRLSEPGAA